MRAKIFICFAFCLAISNCGHAQDTLTVMSYNIYHGESAQKAGKSTIQDIAGFIKKVTPDFVALQEVDSATNRLADINRGRRFNLADSLAKLTGMTDYFGKAIDFDSGNYGLAILSKKLFKVDRIMLPNPANGEPRLLLYLDAQTGSGVPFIFAGTHLDHQYVDNRLAQIAHINKLLTGRNKPVILAGDFNFTPGSDEYQQMENHWLDAAKQLNHRDKSLFTYPSEKPEKRIDHIWLSNTTKWQVLDYETRDVQYSDHLPIVAEIVLN